MAGERSGDGDRGIQRGEVSLQGAAARLGGRVTPSVVDREAGELGQQDDGVLVGPGELSAIVLLGQVEVSVSAAADEDRHPEERAHRRVPGGESVGTMVRAYVRDAERLGVADQLAEHPVAGRQRTDPRLLLLVDAHRQETGQLAAALVEDSQRRIASAGKGLGGSEHTPEHLVDVEPREHVARHLQQGLRRQVGHGSELQRTQQLGSERAGRPRSGAREAADHELQLVLAGGTGPGRPRAGIADEEPPQAVRATKQVDSIGAGHNPSPRPTTC